MSQIAFSAEPSAANPPDIKSAVQGFAAAVILLGISSMSGSLLPLFAAGMIMAYILVVPIGLTRHLGHHRLKAGLVRIAGHASLFVAVGIASVAATNSGFVPVMVLGTLTNIALIAGVSILIFRICLRLAQRIVPLIQREAGRGLSSGLMSIRIALMLLMSTDQAGGNIDRNTSSPTANR